MRRLRTKIITFMDCSPIISVRSGTSIFLSEGTKARASQWVLPGVAHAYAMELGFVK